ncbi:CHASE2 domain-containing sensor protein [Loktanella ponticola]|uniref:CHASE2 domain-containing sensor protein n=1 Tax=Yoonia ponticola TaxID=1524255 RepID=A0A7W9BI47_9RHOB|nr:hypothetical protein [Yoonia ponticola]MBB5720949.1 CHASE2 domain-containing sensor protein [Yoonia ponticola]
MKTPVHLWIVGGFAVLWNAGGAYDYVMTQTQSAAYLAMMSDAQKAFLDAGPIWFEAAWAVGVWFSMLGALLLLLRSRLAAAAFGLSLIGLIVSSVYSFGIADRSGLDLTPAQLGFTAAIYVVLVLLWIYARKMTRRGVLR